MRLIRSKFEKWLKAKPATEVVGERGQCHSCPIALFYQEASGGCEVVVAAGERGYVIDRGDGDRLVPWWVSRFIFQIDGGTDRRITATLALEALSKC